MEHEDEGARMNEPGLVRRVAALALAFALAALAVAQQQHPAPAARDEDEEVVRITSNLIQVDAVVLDAGGQQVTDLTAEDFQLSEDGRAQSITNFSYVDTSPGGAASSSKPAADASKGAVPLPPARVRPEAARRRIAFVVDDLGLSFQATAYVRNFLKDFARKKMRPGDLVAVVRTSAGVGALQQFTGDPRLVERAVELIRFRPGFRAPTGSFAAPAEQPKDAGARDDSGQARAGEKKDAGGENPEAAAPERDSLFTVGTLGALNYVLRGAAEMPGRKSVVLISEAAGVFRLGARGADVREYLQRMADLASRASASVYELDASDLTPGRLGSSAGLVTAPSSAPSQTSSGGSSGPGGQPGPVSPGAAVPGAAANTGLAEMVRSAGAFGGDRARYETKEALRYLSKQTGGAQVFGVERVLEDQRGYYLIGYRPDAEVFDAQRAGRKFHNITLRVKRAGLRVRHRTGFYPAADARSASARPATRPGRLLRALTSPLASGSIGLSLTPLFGNDAQTGSYLRALIHVDARSLKFTEEPGGFRKASVEVLAVTLGESGRPLDSANGVETIRVAAADYERLLASGLRYTLKVPVKSPGAYQLRVAVIDEATEQVGSANELVEVPDFDAGRLALSGIVLSGRLADVAPLDAAPPLNGPAPASQAEMEADPSVRRLRAGMELRYDFHIYNARLDPATGRPKLRVQVRLFREGQAAYEGKLAAFETTQRGDLKRLVAGGAVKLSRAAAPGQYTLQVVVTDLLAPGDRRATTRWIDFEIVR
ncbi:MAG: VWA domain-containing protein [Acidobacteria bacterium]|nr:VWA domain-containing protein [Acidobacteriota bacterium]